MMYRSIKIVFFTFLLAFIYFSVPAQKKIQLKLDLPEGSEHRLVTEVGSKQFSDSALTELKSDILIHLEADIKVLEITKTGVHIIQNTFTRITVKQIFKGQEYFYDTDSTVQEDDVFAIQMAKEYKEMIDFPVLVKLNKKGEIVDRPDSLNYRQFKALSYFENYFIEFPGEKVLKGYSWQIREEGDKTDGMEMTLHYTLVGITGDKVRISVNAGSDDIHLNEEKSALFDQFDLMMNGEITIDQKTGKTLDQHLEQIIHAKTIAMDMHMKTSIKTWFEE